MLEEINKSEMLKTINWLTENTPYRLAGSAQEKIASEYIAKRLEGYGLDVKNEEFRVYNSDPFYSKVEILKPTYSVIESLPCAHIKSTSAEGDIFELVYLGDGTEKAYENVNVKGKMVLVEVSYAPPVPEKARIAYKMGAAGIMCMNWGNDEDVICHRALKAVWGNPTESTVQNIPNLVGVGITRCAGLKLKEKLVSGQNVVLRVTALANRKWSMVHQPTGVLRSRGDCHDFLLVCSHLDAWEPGVTCNATGNATTLEICRILSKYRDELRRDVHFVFWNGHEIAEAAGSTWYLDNNWDQINKHCVGYVHIDSTGVENTKLFEIKASDEMLEYAKVNFSQVLPGTELRAMSLKKIGDQSYMGIGIPSVAQRMSFTQADMEASHGATLGWWNHTNKDGIDKCNPEILVKDTKVTLKLIYDWLNCDYLPYDFSWKLDDFKDKVQKVAEKYKKHMSFDDLLTDIEYAADCIAKVQVNMKKYNGDNVKIYNEFVKKISRLTTDIMMTYADKYSQDSYGYTKLSFPIPLLADLERLEDMEPGTFEYGLVKTQLLKNKNRICDALVQAADWANLHLLNY